MPSKEVIAAVSRGLYAEQFSNGQINIGAGDFKDLWPHQPYQYGWATIPPPTPDCAPPSLLFAEVQLSDASLASCQAAG